MHRLLLICWLLLLFFPGYGQILVRETFTYPLQSSLEGSGTDTLGWAGGWSLNAPQNSSTVSDQPVRNAELGIQSMPPGIQITSGPQGFYDRKLADPITLDQPVWIGFLAEADYVQAETKGSLGLIDETFDTLQQVRVEWGKDWGSRQVVADGNGVYPRATGSVFNSGQWIVALLQPAPDGTITAYTWVNPEPDQEPDTATARVVRPGVAIHQIHAVQLTAIPQSGLTWQLDDLYIGHDFASIRPGNWDVFTPEPVVYSAREPFSYTVGVGLENANGSAGFGGPWQRVTGFNHPVDDSAINYGEEQQTEPPVLNLDHSNDQTNVRFVRPLKQHFPDDGGTYWLAAIMAIDYQNDRNVAQLFLADYTSLGSSGPAGQLLQIGKSFQNDQFTVGVPGNFTSANGLPVASSYLAVVRIRTSGDAGPEQIDVWIDPDPNADEPSLSQRVLTRSQPLNDGWSALGIKIEGESGIQMLVDDLAIGRTYREVLPMTAPTSLTSVHDQARFDVFPNPGSGMVTTRHNVRGKLEVYDATGRLVERRSVHQQANTNLQVLPEKAPAGLYTLVLHTPSIRYSTTYLKQ